MLPPSGVKTADDDDDEYKKQYLVEAQWKLSYHIGSFKNYLETFIRGRDIYTIYQI